MKIRLLLTAVAAAAGGAYVLGRRRKRRTADAALWAEATDHVAPTPRHAG